jgi:hypothetical protein
MSMLLIGDWTSEDENLRKKKESKCQGCGHVNVVNDSDVDITWSATLLYSISVSH